MLSQWQVLEVSKMERLGIFLSQEKWRQFKNLQNSPGLKALVRAVESLGLPVLYFSLPQDRLEEGLLLGTTFSHQVFKLRYYPIPPMIYDLGVFPPNYRESKKAVRKALEQKEVQFLNTRSAFSKWSTYTLLSTDPQIAPHLPKTVLFEHGDDLLQMLSDYPKVCVKSLWGSRGKEVLFIEKKGDRFSLIYPDGIVKRYLNLDELANSISFFMKGNNWLIQETVNLATWKNCRIDLRALVQKVTLQRWACTALCLRRAQPHGLITSTSHGGTVFNAFPILSKLWPSHSEELVKEVKKLSLHVAQTLENHVGPLGELGIDIGVDQDGQIWLFEVNGKPGKTTIRKLGNKRKIRLAYERPLRYAALRLEEEK